MKNLYMKKIGLVLLMVSMMLPVSANYISRAPGGDFNHPANWNSNEVPIDVDRTITISTGSAIDKSDDFVWGANITVENGGVLIVNGDFSLSQTLTINQGGSVIS